MTLAAGTHLGPYEILGAIGSGGLPPAFVNDPDRRERFQREAQADSR